VTVGKGIVAACICPHPPLLIPAIGGRELAKVENSVHAMQELSIILGELAHDVLVVISPHTPIPPASFSVSASERLVGDFTQFGCRQVSLERPNDLELAKRLLSLSETHGVPLTTRTRQGEVLDHGVLVPLFYIGAATQAPIVSLSIAWLPYHQHFALGELVRECCEEMGRRAILIASGDLSHRLLPGSPNGYSPRGREFDNSIVRIVEQGTFDQLASLDESMVEEAGECGLRSIHAMWGALHTYGLRNRLLSYEGPFGVGYLVSLHQTEE
jgi:aromatic ring-opening dioxygenase LigB subunit